MKRLRQVLEPRTATYRKRFETVQALNGAGYSGQRHDGPWYTFP